MKVAIIISNLPADQSIKKELLKNFKKTSEKYWSNPVYEFENLKLYEDTTRRCTDIDDVPSADLYVFATIHKSSSERPCLTVHPPGNWNDARDGGEEKTLAIAPTAYFREFYLNLKTVCEPKDIDVEIEATHHGPTPNSQVLFVEIGSSEKEWENPEYAELMAQTIIKTFTKTPKELPSALIIGGTHYSKTAIKAIENNYAPSHICPKHHLEFLDEEMILQAINKTFPTPRVAIVDWKGLGKEKQRVVALVEKHLEIKRSDKLTRL